ncbi:PREDICTED: lipopolysaccharide-induced tumor necrosis factor-alpha factor homolog isoform X2 [Eufriesea mexicana]|uniref:lipopolysaccharide-induced tumor necrosis factor-alpha factor homolog isoform X2 n=1 Tax=Eufriesea mexicana TaxID=516756 RepID=UPI00083C0E7B|nr:PREDICTED: lipopolysaccharide-induced tumor necrosis factor-alpha factor homolog isoform X2 [Eufriesea mexicana]
MVVVSPMATREGGMAKNMGLPSANMGLPGANMGLVAGNIQPTAPPPSELPPSYEEAVTSTSTPAPTHSQSPAQTSSVPYPTNYSGPVEPPPLTQTQYNANANTVPPQEFPVVYRPVIYSLSSSSIKTVCPTCRANIKTTTISDRQPGAHLCCIILCLFGCCCCSCLPYCMGTFMSVHHFCPKCKRYIGTWKG